MAYRRAAREGFDVSSEWTGGRHRQRATRGGDAGWSLAIRDGLRTLAPDVIGLQEVVRLDPGEGDELDQCDAIGGELGYHAAYGRAREQRWYGNAVLSRWPIRRSAVIDLPRGGTDEPVSDSRAARVVGAHFAA